MRYDAAAIPHLAFFLPHLGGGGTEKMVSTLANELSASGYDVDMVLVKAVGVHLQTLSRNIRVFDLGARNSYLAMPALAAYLRRRRPPVLVSALPLTNLLALIARALAGSRTRIAVRIENTVSAQQRAPWKKVLEKSLLSWLYPGADRIIAVSHAVASDAAEYLHIPLSRIDVLYNPVLSVERAAPGLPVPVHPWFAEGCPPVILAAGRLTPAKDFPTLIKAFAQVRSQRSARLIILGEGEQRSQLLSMVRDLGVAQDVEMPGFVEDPYSYMKSCKVFVLSSIYEGLPTVLIEALASGCAVVSTDCPGGAREILADGAYGDLVPMGSAEAMAAAIGKVLDGDRKAVDPAWLDQFRVERVLEQNIQLLGLPRTLQ